jgi:TRAP-type C4-dicarboxylate transport system substrate-binding protein
MKIVGFASSGIANFHMKDILAKTPSDFKGQRVWPANSIGVQCAKLWGAVPTLVKMADIYMSLQRGTLDGVWFPTPPIADFRFTDMIKNHTLCGFCAGSQAVVINQAKWDSLPSDIQKIFDELTLPLSIAIGNKFGEMNDHIIGELRKRGDNIYVLSRKEKDEWRASIQPIFDAQAADITAAGRDGKAIMAKIQTIVAEAREKPSKVTQDWQVVKE